MSTSQGLVNNSLSGLLSRKGIAEGLIDVAVVMNRVQIIETEGFDLQEPVESDYDSEDSNGELPHLLSDSTLYEC